MPSPPGNRQSLPPSPVSLNSKGQDVPLVFKLPSFTYTNSKRLRWTLIKILLLFFLSPYMSSSRRSLFYSPQEMLTASLCSSSPFIAMVEMGRQAGYWASLALQAGCCYKPVFLSWCHEPNPAQRGHSTTAHGHGRYG